MTVGEKTQCLIEFITCKECLSLISFTVILLIITIATFFIIDFNIWNKTGKSFYKKAKKEILKK